MVLEGIKRPQIAIKRGRSKSYPLMNLYFQKLNVWRSLRWGNKTIARTLRGEGVWIVIIWLRVFFTFCVLGWVVLIF